MQNIRRLEKIRARGWGVFSALLAPLPFVDEGNGAAQAAAVWAGGGGVPRAGPQCHGHNFCVDRDPVLPSQPLFPVPSSHGTEAILDEAPCSSVRD